MAVTERTRGAGADASRRARGQLIRYGRIVGGTCLAAAGVLLMVLPGPGIPLLVAGFLLLEREFEWARPLRLALLRRLEALGKAARRMASWAVRRGTSSDGTHVEARSPSAHPRPPLAREPWVSRRHWRRALAISIEAGLTPAERRELLARLARVRTGDVRSRASGRRRFARNGERGTAGPPLPGAGFKEEA